ncbi:MAG: hypothetical protein SPJ13_01030 [Bacteroidales bacterium]|nr:hypothetical protein [Bacteroidales bacterium]
MDSTATSRYKATLGRYLKPDVVDKVFAFFNRHETDLHITRARRSKWGDYRWPQHGCPRHVISVNGNLNPYLFLMVLLHEMAHLLTYQQYKGAVLPHGHEWQDNYRRLLAQYAEAGHFPQESLPALKRYTAQLPLYGPAGNEFEETLRRYDKDYDPLASLTLNELPIGSRFRLKSKPEMLFESLEKLRTRYRCIELHSGVPFLVAGRAQVVREN